MPIAAQGRRRELSAVNRRILIVEDDAAARDCYARLFRRHGYETLLAASGRWVEANPGGLEEVGLILLDLRMPGLGGLELLSRLRGRGLSAPAFVVSAQAGPEISEEAARLGILRIFHKPVEPAALLRGVAEAFTLAKEGRKGQKLLQTP
jgi:two-component system response regulator FixJ